MKLYIRIVFCIKNNGINRKIKQKMAYDRSWINE